MDIFAPISRDIIAPLWAIKERSPYLRHLKYLEESQYYPLNQLYDIQWKKLKTLINHAYEHVPFYQEKFNTSGFNPNDLQSWEDLAQIPILSKDDIRRNKHDLIATNFNIEKLMFKKTSGSTGISLEFYVDEDSLQWKRACAARHDRWAGWDLGARVAAIWGNPDHFLNWRMRLRNVLLDRYTYLDTLKMDKQNMEEFYRAVKKKPPSIFFGHAHSLYLFARYIKENGFHLPKANGIISTAMVLHSHERELIESVFDCKVFNRYGCEEVSLIASECEMHSGLHMNLDTLIIEIIRNNKQVQNNEPGSIVVTDLTNYGMPFIRYKVGDVGVISEEKCQCGREFPLFKSIEGRTADFIVTPEGNFISGISLTENFAMKLSGISQIQIVQEKLDFLRFRIVKAEKESEDIEKGINLLFKERFGDKMSYNIEYVNSIQQEESGKYRFCISKIANDFH